MGGERPLQAIRRFNNRMNTHTHTHTHIDLDRWKGLGRGGWATIAAGTVSACINPPHCSVGGGGRERERERETEAANYPKP